MSLSEPGCRRVMSIPVRPGADCLSLNDGIVESIYTQGQINFFHSIPCVTALSLSLLPHIDNHSGMFLCEDLTIFLHLNLNVQLYFICRALNHLCASITRLGDHVRSFGIKTSPCLRLQKCHCLVLVPLYGAVYTAAMIPPWPPALSASHQER